MAEETRDFTELESFMTIYIGDIDTEVWMVFVARIAIRTLGRMGIF